MSQKLLEQCKQDQLKQIEEKQLQKSIQKAEEQLWLEFSDNMRYKQDDDEMKQKNLAAIEVLNMQVEEKMRNNESKLMEDKMERQLLERSAFESKITEEKQKQEKYLQELQWKNELMVSCQSSQPVM